MQREQIAALIADESENMAYVADPSTYELLYVNKAVVRGFGLCGDAYLGQPCYRVLQGLETLSLRVERHVENALRVVDFLVNHPKVERVNHPSLPENGYRPLYEKYFPRGGGSIFTFEIKGGAAEAQAFIDKLRIFSLLANVADVKSLAIHPASTTHSQMTPEELAQSGIRPNTIRLSIGTEHIDDILADLAAALEA